MALHQAVHHMPLQGYRSTVMQHLDTETLQHCLPDKAPLNIHLGPHQALSQSQPFPIRLPRNNYMEVLRSITAEGRLRVGAKQVPSPTLVPASWGRGLSLKSGLSRFLLRRTGGVVEGHSQLPSWSGWRGGCFTPAQGRQGLHMSPSG